MSNPDRVEVATITAQNTFTNPIPVSPGEKVAIAVGGSITGTVTPQVMYPPSTDWFDFGNDTLSAVGFKVVEPGATALVRAGVKTGAYTGGTIAVQVKAG